MFIKILYSFATLCLLAACAPERDTTESEGHSATLSAASSNHQQEDQDSPKLYLLPAISKSPVRRADTPRPQAPVLPDLAASALRPSREASLPRITSGSLASIFEELETTKLTRPLQTTGTHGALITPIRKFTGGGTNMGVYALDVADGAPVIARFEQWAGDRTVAQQGAQLAIRGSPYFAQVRSRKTFMSLRHGKYIVGEIMTIGGDDFAPFKDEPRVLLAREAKDMAASFVFLNRHGILNSDAKPQNFVHTLGKVGAMAIDLADMTKISELNPEEYIGPFTFLPPESKRMGVVYTGARKEYDAAYHMMVDQVRAHGPAAANNWLLGHTLFYTITGIYLNAHNEAWPIYPGSSRLRYALRESIAHSEKNEGVDYSWVRVHENDLLGLLHPDPTQRRTAALISLRMKFRLPGPPINEWDTIHYDPPPVVAAAAAP